MWTYNYQEAIVPGGSGLEDCTDDELEYQKLPKGCGCSIYMLLCLLGMSTNLAVNALWIEIPILKPKLPEGHFLSIYILALWELGNITAAIYLLCHKFRPTEKSRTITLYLCLFLNVVCVAFLGFFWDYKVMINKSNHSLIFLICMAILGQVSSLSSVSLIPYTSTLKEKYITAIIIGDSLSVLLPHGFGLAAGLAIPPECKPNPISINYNNTHFMSLLHPGKRRPTASPIIVPQKLRFPEYVYFYSICGLLLLSCISFLLLRYVRLFQLHYEKLNVDCMLDDSELISHGQSGSTIEDFDNDAIMNSSNCDMKSRKTQHKSNNNLKIKSKTSLSNSGHRSERSINIAIHPSDTMESDLKNSNTKVKIVAPTKSKKNIDESKVPSFTLLMLITFWASVVTLGPLSSSKSHACLPIGNTYYFVGTISTNVGAVFTCLFVLRIRDRLQIPLVVAFTSLASILLSYFVALITFNHTSDSQENSPIFGTFGELLVTLAWTAIFGLFYFARVTIAAICRKGGAEFMIWYAAITQLGAAIGSLCMIDNLSICRIYKNYQEATCTET